MQTLMRENNGTGALTGFVTKTNNHQKMYALKSLMSMLALGISEKLLPVFPLPKPKGVVLLLMR